MLDCREPAGRMWAWEEGDRWMQDLTLAQWLQAWLDDRLTIPARLSELTALQTMAQGHHPG
jgi:hypothetical protein